MFQVISIRIYHVWVCFKVVTQLISENTEGFRFVLLKVDLPINLYKLWLKLHNYLLAFDQEWKDENSPSLP